MSTSNETVEVEWTIEVTETWKTTVTVDDLVEAINGNLDPDVWYVDPDPVDADTVRKALADGTFTSTYGDILSRDGGALPDWEDSTRDGTTVYSAVTERDLDSAKFAEVTPDAA